LRDQSLDSTRSNRGLYDAKYVNIFCFLNWNALVFV
jgi:hypothetical protein